MIQLTSGGASLRIRPAMPRSAPFPQRHLDWNILQRGIAARRHRLAELETSMVAACEHAAVCGACRNVRIDDYETWDKATWHRYLEAVARLEPDYMPKMRRLLRDIDRFERLLSLPIQPSPPMSRTEHWHRTTSIGFGLIQGSQDHKALLDKRLRQDSSGHPRATTGVARFPRVFAV